MEGVIQGHATGTVRRQGRRRPSLHKDVRFLACSGGVPLYRTRLFALPVYGELDNDSQAGTRTVYMDFAGRSRIVTALEQ